MKPYLLWGLIFLLNTQLKTQELPITQFYNRPIQLNPALTGEFQEDFRLYSLNRSQWSDINSHYTSINVGGELNIRSRKNKRFNIGLGLFLNSENQANILKKDQYAVALAYHHKVDRRGRHILGLGLSGYLVQQQLDESELRFGNQYQYYTYQENIDNQEDLSQYSRNYNEIGFGLNYSFIWSKSTLIQVGSSLKSNLPNTTKTTDLQSYIRLEENLGKVRLRPTIYWHKYGKLNRLMAELITFFEVLPSLQTSIFGGISYRSEGATILHGGIEYKHLILQGSYDISMSDLRSSETVIYPTNYLSAWEIGLIWKGFYNKHRAKEFSIPCGFF